MSGSRRCQGLRCPTRAPTASLTRCPVCLRRVAACCAPANEQEWCRTCEDRGGPVRLGEFNRERHLRFLRECLYPRLKWAP